MTTSRTAAFTLVELSIVLVIIGLLVGGVLTGRDLIKSAEIRAQISQIEEYKTAVNTFQAKYGYLAGDMPPSEAAALGFFTFTGANAGQDVGGFCAFGDNDGSINPTNEAYPFWSHLSDAKLVKGISAGTLVKNASCLGNYGTLGGYPTTAPSTTTGGWAEFIPQAKMGGANAFVTVQGNHRFKASSPVIIYSNTQKSNMFSILDQSLGWPNAFSPLEMYQIDSKIDDGFPATGTVRDDGTADGGNNIYNLDDSTNNGFSCTKAGVADDYSDQTYDLKTDPNGKNCYQVDFLW